LRYEGENPLESILEFSRHIPCGIAKYYSVKFLKSVGCLE